MDLVVQVLRRQEYLPPVRPVPQKFEKHHAYTADEHHQEERDEEENAFPPACHPSSRFEQYIVQFDAVQIPEERNNYRNCSYDQPSQYPLLHRLLGTLRGSNQNRRLTS